MADQPPRPAPAGVSVVIPAREAATTLPTSVSSALDQRYDGDLEVVIAVADGDVETQEAAARLAATDGRVSVVVNEAGTTPAGLNTAIAASRGSVIVRLDAHATLPPGYVASAVSTLTEQPDVVNVGGRQVARGDRFISRAVAIAQTTPIGVGDARYRLGGDPGPVDTVYLGVFRRSALERAGGFDEAMVRNQDAELNIRLRRRGGVVWFDPELAVEYEARATLGALWRQYFGYGTYRRATVRKHPGSMKLRQLAPPLFVAALLASLVLLVLPFRQLGIVIPTLYLGTVLFTALWEAARRADVAGLALLLVLPTMHVAWGLGFLIGRPEGQRSR